MQAMLGEISQIAFVPVAWDLSHMAKKDVSRGISAQLEDLLMAAKPADQSISEWCRAASVSTSFFTDLRNGSEPGIDKVERLAQQAGLKLTELIEGAEAKRTPTASQLASMLEVAQSELPVGVKLGDYPTAVAASLHAQLQRFLDGISTASSEKPELRTNPAEASQSQRPTKRAAQG